MLVCLSDSVRVRSRTQPDYEAESRARQQQIAALEAELQEISATEKTRAGHLKHVTDSLQKQREELEQGEHERRAAESKISEFRRWGGGEEGGNCCVD